MPQAKLSPQNAEDGDFTDLEGFDLSTKLGLLRKNEQWKCQVKKEVLQASPTLIVASFFARVQTVEGDGGQRWRL